MCNVYGFETGTQYEMIFCFVVDVSTLIDSCRESRPKTWYYILTVAVTPRNTTRASVHIGTACYIIACATSCVGIRPRFSQYIYVCSYFLIRQNSIRPVRGTDDDRLSFLSRLCPFPSGRLPIVEDRINRGETPPPLGAARRRRVPVFYFFDIWHAGRFVVAIGANYR